MLILMGKSQLYVTEKGLEKEPGLTSNHFCILFNNYASGLDLVITYLTSNESYLFSARRNCIEEFEW